MKAKLVIVLLLALGSIALAGPDKRPEWKATSTEALAVSRLTQEANDIYQEEQKLARRKNKFQADLAAVWSEAKSNHCIQLGDNEFMDFDPALGVFFIFSGTR